MQDSAQAHQVILEQFKSEMEELSLRWGRDTKEKAERVLNASLSASKEAMARLMREGAEATAIVVKEQIDESLANATGQIRAAKYVATLNILASFITFLAAFAAVWASLH